MPDSTASKALSPHSLVSPSAQPPGRKRDLAFPDTDAEVQPSPEPDLAGIFPFSAVRVTSTSSNNDNDCDVNQPRAGSYSCSLALLPYISSDFHN